MYYTNFSKLHLVIVSFFVYIFVNLFENLIHYNIGRSSNHDIELKLPSKTDWIRIIIVMFIFAALQGILTYYFDTL